MQNWLDRSGQAGNSATIIGPQSVDPSARLDRQRHLLGPVFAAAGLEVPTHLPRIADFWERSLLATGRYSGRPRQIHRHLMQTAGLAERHVDRWLELWHQALREGYAVRMGRAMLRQGPGEGELPLAPVTWP